MEKKTLMGLLGPTAPIIAHRYAKMGISCSPNQYRSEDTKKSNISLILKNLLYFEKESHMTTTHKNRPYTCISNFLEDNNSLKDKEGC